MTPRFAPERLEHPVRIDAASCGTHWSVTTQRPGHFRTHVHSVHKRLAVLPGAQFAAWHGRKLWWAQGNAVSQFDPAHGASVLLPFEEPGAVVGVLPGRAVFRTATGFTLAQLSAPPVHLPATHPLGLPRISPCGSFIALINVGELALFTATGAHCEERFVMPGWCVTAADFLPSQPGSLVVSLATPDSLQRKILIFNALTGEQQPLLREISTTGFVRLPGAVATSRGVVWVRYENNWPLMYAYDLASGEETALLPGQHEDFSELSDIPAVSPDGTRVVFNSGACNARERHLYVHDLPSGTTEQVTFAAGTTSLPTWLGNNALLYRQTTAEHAAEVYCLSLPGKAVQCTALNTFSAVPPRPVRLLHTVPGDVYMPSTAKPGDARPAVVYAHGGIFRQMFAGFHPSFGYSILHLLNQALVERGYVVLSVDYRGSTGYGRAFEQANFRAAGEIDVADCATAAQWLAEHPAVDPARIGIWGLSWGGTMVLHALTKYPDLFAAGVSLAGIWDYAQRAAFWAEQQRGQPIYFDGRMGSVDEYGDSPWHDRASARNFVSHMRAPLLSFHGTADESVDYAQQQLLVADAARHGKDVTAITFPGERHVFTSVSAWQSVMHEMLAFFDAHLARGNQDDE